MNLKKILSEKNILMQLKAQSKDGVLVEMATFLADSGLLGDRDKAIEALREREGKMSTGMQHGIAIPHAKTDAVTDMIALIALKKEGLDFQALDGKPCTMFIMTLSPLNRTGPHIQFLAEISRLLSEESARERLLAAQTASEALAAIIH